MANHISCHNYLHADGLQRRQVRNVLWWLTEGVRKPVIDLDARDLVLAKVQLCERRQVVQVLNDLRRSATPVSVHAYADAVGAELEHLKVLEAADAFDARDLVVGQEQLLQLRQVLHALNRPDRIVRHVQPPVPVSTWWVYAART